MKLTRRQWLKRSGAFVPATFGILRAQSLSDPAFVASMTQPAAAAGGSGQHTFVNKSQHLTQSSNPIVVAHTPGTAATVIAVSIIGVVSEVRAGGAATIGGSAATDSGEGVVAGTEAHTEVVYRCAAFDGSEVSISIPNTNSDQFHIEAVSFYASSGYDSAFDDSGSDSGDGTDATPTVTTTVAYDAIYASLACGHADIASITAAQTVMYEYDHGNWTHSNQYMLKSDTGAQVMLWEITDDYGAIAAAFKTVAQ